MVVIFAAGEPSVTIQAESGQRDAGNIAAVATMNGASGGKAVRFGSMTAPTPTAPTPVPGGTVSGLPWPSGVHAANELGPHLEFGTWRGRPIDVLMTFTNRGNWDGLIKAEPYLTLHRTFYQDKSKVYVISQPPYPQGGNNGACASGAYNGNWEQFGQTLSSKGLNHRNTIIRIAWEFNGNFMYWHTDPDPANFKKCWQNVARSIKKAAPNVRTDWTLNGHGAHANTPSCGNVCAYPGDDVVDIIGIDEYDHYPAAADMAAFDQRCNRPDLFSVCGVADFAKQHGKEFSVGEWSVKHCGSDTIYDNPVHVRGMHKAFMANTTHLAYEAYYDDTIDGNVCSSLFRTNTNGTTNPQAAAAYKELFGQRTYRILKRPFSPLFPQK